MTGVKEKLKVLIYVSGPYTDKTKESIEKNIENARNAGIRLSKKGYSVIIPHMNTAYFDEHNGQFIEDSKTELSGKFWLAQDFELLSRCDIVYVLKERHNQSNERSVGTDMEVRLAKELGIPIVHEVCDEKDKPLEDTLLLNHAENIIKTKKRNPAVCKFIDEIFRSSY
ncbi:MAG: DUF4406 domain-containing protein [Candidatus Nanoarchaeia archaeon]|nr:DUF4406 domain-containing protein [Candidatus Nanoarchaeia archaeon]